MGVTAWVDQNGSNPGSELDAANLNADTAADTTEAATNDTLGAGSTYVNNLNRIRYQLLQLGFGSWKALSAVIPLSQKAAANGVASLNASGHVVQAGSVNPATAGLASGVATLDSNGRLVQMPASGVRQMQAKSLFGTSVSINPNVVLGSFGNGFAMTTTGGIIVAEMSLGLVHTGVDTGQSIEFYLQWTGAGTGNSFCGTVNGYAVPQNARTQLYLMTVVSGLAAGSYTFSFAYDSGAVSGWTTGDGFNYSFGKLTEFE